MKLACLLQSGISPEHMQKLSGLEGDQSILNLVVLRVCKIGYCPILSLSSPMYFQTTWFVLKDTIPHRSELPVLGG